MATGRISDAEIARRVLELDARMLTGAFPDREPDPLDDQIMAASADATRLSNEAVAAGFYKSIERRAWVDNPDWVRLGALDTLVRWVLGAARVCLHNPTRDRPEPVFGAAWKPGLVVCTSCVRLLRFKENSVRDRTCDGCGKVVEGAAAGDPIYSEAFHISVLTYGFGTCEACRLKLVR